MERRQLGRTDMEASGLGFGGSAAGYGGGRPAAGTAPAAAGAGPRSEAPSLRPVDRRLGAAIDAGLNVIDTAECYEDSEALIGAALGSRRNDVHLLTTCGHPSGYGAPDP